MGADHQCPALNYGDKDMTVPRFGWLGSGRLGRNALRMTAMLGIVLGVNQIVAYDQHSTNTRPVQESRAGAGDNSCPAWTKCPLDGAQSNLVNTEYQGIVAIGVYEHTTTTGETHRFRMRCN
jgi:hypothetical protein